MVETVKVTKEAKTGLKQCQRIWWRTLWFVSDFPRLQNRLPPPLIGIVLTCLITTIRESKSNLYWVLFPYPQKSIPNSYGLHLPIFLVTIWNIYCNVCNVCDLRSCQINSFCRWEGWNLPFATSLDTQWPYLDSTTCLPGQYEDQKHLHPLEVVEKVYLTRLVYCVNTQRRYTTIDTWHSHSGHWMNQLILFIFN